MIEDVKEFIGENIDLIENNQWEEIYKILQRVPTFNSGEFTLVILEAGINPLDYLNYIPNRYLFGSKYRGGFIVPGRIKNIGDQAFGDCKGLTSVTIPDSVKSMAGWVFIDCNSLVSVTMPGTINDIGDSMFHGCRSLVNITIPSNVTRIGNSAFSKCSSLTNINIPDSVTKMGNFAFADCKNLKYITLPSNLIKMPYGIFIHCNNLTDIYYRGTVEQWNKLKKDEDWNFKSSIATIKCVDGDVKLK